jgi:hypothetical protein
MLAETPGATMSQVKQKCGGLEMHAYHPDWGLSQHLHEFLAELREASRSICEACGAQVPAVPLEQVTWRTHCAACSARLGVLRAEGPLHAEVRLWEERAGCVWPERES